MVGEDFVDGEGRAGNKRTRDDEDKEDGANEAIRLSDDEEDAPARGGRAKRRRGAIMASEEESEGADDESDSGSEEDEEFLKKLKLITDPEKRRAVRKMNQVDRERYLFDLEERLKEEAIRQRNIALAHQANDALQGGKKSRRSGDAKSTVNKQQRDALAGLAAAREKREKKKGRRGRKRADSDAEEGSEEEEGKADEDEDYEEEGKKKARRRGAIAASEGEEEEEEEEEEDRGRGRRGRRRAYSDDEDAGGYRDTGDTLATLEEVRSITLTRSRLQQYFTEPWFEDLVPGCYVKIAKRAGQAGERSALPEYVLARITGIADCKRGQERDGAARQEAEYKFGLKGQERLTSKFLLLDVPNKGRDTLTPMHFVSDRPAEEAEFHAMQGSEEFALYRSRVDEALAALRRAAHWTTTDADAAKSAAGRKARGEVGVNPVKEEQELRMRLDDMLATGAPTATVYGADRSLEWIQARLRRLAGPRGAAVREDHPLATGSLEREVEYLVRTVRAARAQGVAKARVYTELRPLQWLDERIAQLRATQRAVQRKGAASMADLNRRQKAVGSADGAARRGAAAATAAAGAGAAGAALDPFKRRECRPRIYIDTGGSKAAEAAAAAAERAKAAGAAAEVGVGVGAAEEGEAPVWGRALRLEDLGGLEEALGALVQEPAAGYKAHLRRLLPARWIPSYTARAESFTKVYELDEALKVYAGDRM